MRTLEDGYPWTNGRRGQPSSIDGSTRSTFGWDGHEKDRIRSIYNPITYTNLLCSYQIKIYKKK